MAHDESARLAHIRMPAINIARWISGRTWEQFEQDDMLQAAVAYELQVTGEAAGRLTAPTRDRFSSVPCDKIIKMRHRLVHDYFVVDPVIVWNVATIHLPEFIQQIAESHG